MSIRTILKPQRYYILDSFYSQQLKPLSILKAFVFKFINKKIFKITDISSENGE